jgi:pheromone a factor receptor
MSFDISFSFPRYPSAVVLPVFSALTVVLDLPPLIWHCKNRNLAASSLVFWIILLNLFNVVNAIIWPTDNVEAWWNGVGLCDVEAKLYVGAWVALTGAIASIMRSLARIMDTDNQVLIPSKGQRRRQLALDLLLCVGAPVLVMALHYITQFNRYYVFAIAGCVPGFDNSWPTTLLVFMWPPILTLLASFYAGMCLVVVGLY